MKTTATATRITAALFAVAVSTLLLGGTAVAMTAEAEPQQQVIVMERVTITPSAVN